ncbi:MAG: hypothetical protein PHX42_00845 [Candidatus Methanomethylophilaceae archaeon]|jgi:hypothetical protein|nr:hypothetical protein [Candidatus Methanomethylophilaceae archaeon]
MPKTKAVTPEGRRTFSLFRGEAPKQKDIRFRTHNRPIMVFDESGSTGPLGSDEPDPRSVFTVVSTLAEDSNQFKKVVSAFPRKKKGEFKYANATMKDAEPVFDRLTETDFTFSERHRSRRNETFKDADKAKEFYVGAISEMIDEGNPKIPFDVIIDEPPIETGPELKALCRDKLKEGLEIEWFEVSRSSEEHALQVNDFITGAVGDNVNGIKGKEKLYAKIRGRRR